MMNISMDKPLDYKYFLLGIILYWMFDALWTSLFPTVFFASEAVLHPVAVVVGKSVAYLLVFYFLFRKPRMFNVKWGHFAIFVGAIVLINFLTSFIFYRFIDLSTFSASQMKWDIPNYTMKNVRMWVNLVTTLLTVGFIWCRYDSDNAATDPEISSSESRSFYAGMLFTITLGYILSVVNVLGSEYWKFAHFPILVEVITCLLIVLITIGAVLMLNKRQTMVLSITAIIIIITIHFFLSHYLPNIMSKCLTPNDAFYGQVNYFGYVSIF
ncbi:MAG: hypothetical protein J6X16_07135, partial [Bacteroidales bacterium]|nr:hypothetical protein [Bacteroidales bacterium]